MGDIVTFRQHNGFNRTWVPKDKEAWWIEWWGRGGVPAARWVDYQRWGGFYPPARGIGGYVMLRPNRRQRRSYRRFTFP